MREKHYSAPVILPVLETTKPRQRMFSDGAKIACWTWRAGIGLLGLRRFALRHLSCLRHLRCSIGFSPWTCVHGFRMSCLRH